MPTIPWWIPGPVEYFPPNPTLPGHMIPNVIPTYPMFQDVKFQNSHAKEDLMESYVNDVSTKSGFDPATIIAIISAVINAISQCKPPTPAPVPPVAHADLIQDSIRNRIALNRALRDNDIRPLSHNGRKLIDSMIERAQTATEAETGEFLAMCQ